MRESAKDYILKMSGKRRPVFMPGSLFSSPLPKLMSSGNFSRESLRNNTTEIARYARLFSEETGVDSVSLPSVMTLESEAYGGETEDTGVEAVVDYPFDGVSDYAKIKRLDAAKDARLPQVIEAISLMKSRANGKAVIADVAGAVGLASSVTHAKGFLKSLVSEPENAREFLKRLSENTCVVTEAFAIAGADIICVMEPFAGYLTIGPGFFRDFAVDALNRVSRAARKAGAYSMLHLCGDAGLLGGEALRLDFDFISVDNTTQLGELKACLDKSTLFCGNICSETLSVGNQRAIEGAVKNAIAQGADIIMPSCGIYGESALSGIITMVKAARSDVS